MKTKILVLWIIVNLFSTVHVGYAKSDEIPYYMFNAANVFSIDISLLYALCKVESQCNSKALNKNDATKARKLAGIKEHSHGLFQIKYATAKAIGFKGTKKDLMKPEINTWYAAKLLNCLYKKHKTTEKVLSAYNAGRVTPGNNHYVLRVLTEYAYNKINRKL